MSEGNGDGVIRITTAGMVRFAIGDGEPFEIDVIAVVNQWDAIDESFRDEKRLVPKEKWTEFYECQLNFVRELALGEEWRDKVKADPKSDITLTGAFHFMKHLRLEGDKLRTFFAVDSPKEPSSPPSSPTVAYSE